MRREAVERQRALRSVRHEATDAERARQAFLSGLNHELRTPLNHIIGFAELLQEADSFSVPPEKRAEYVDLILGSAHTLLDQINAILMASGYGAPSGGDEEQGAVIPVLRRLLQEHAGSLFISKVDIDESLPASALAGRDLYRIFQMVFAAIGGAPGRRRAIGLTARRSGAGDGFEVRICTMSQGEAVEPAALRAPRTELTQLGGRLDHTRDEGGEDEVVVTLPAHRTDRAA